jgi:hypothetical protein
MRIGRIPDWLRLDLIDRLKPGREAGIREALTNLLAIPAADKGSGESLEIATSEPQLIFRWLQRIAQTAEGVAYRDAIFLSFMRGRRPNHLILKTPDALVKQLRPHITMIEWVGLMTAVVTSSLFSPPAAE